MKTKTTFLEAMKFIIGDVDPETGKYSVNWGDTLGGLAIAMFVPAMWILCYALGCR